MSSAEYATADAGVICRRWFYIDIDPVRPSGISSTEGEREAALATLELLTRFLSEAGWPEPPTAMSGNGYYALYRVDLPNNPEGTVLIKSVLQSLASRFDTPGARVDTTVSNASRIAALIGTLKRKGDPTAERPHRRSELVWVPGHLDSVDEGLLRVVVESTQKRAESAQHPGHATSTQGGSLKEALEVSGIQYREQPPDSHGTTWYHVRQCPFHDDGRPFECGVGQKLPDGPFAGKCFHPEGVGKGWQEWKQALSLRVGRNGHEPSPSNNGDTTGARETDRLSDTWNAHRSVAENQGDLLWCEIFKQWFVYDGTRYARDVTREVERRAEKTVTQLYEYAAGLPDGDERGRMAGWGMNSESRHRITNMVESAKRMSPVHPSEFDRDPLLLNILNGTIDLRTQQLRPHRRADRLTKRAGVRFDAWATCPQWLSFLERIFAGNQALIGFTKRLFGYCLTGLLTDHSSSSSTAPAPMGRAPS